MKNHTCMQHHSMGHSLLWLASAGTLAHALTHVLALMPLILGLTMAHSHDHSVAELTLWSITLNLVMHIGMALMVIVADRMRNKSYLW